MIYHITTPEIWKVYANEEQYEASSLKEEGFIHCSTEVQIKPVLERYFMAIPEICILYLNEAILGDTLRYEPSTNDEIYPHIYGSIPKKAIERVVYIKQPFTNLP
ncbi:MAG: DUF952 domain-containing protein [Cytophagales bacterium]|nr:MAG: DUF952 domain-containing protein [Cytophagales bacterium]